MVTFPQQLRRLKASNKDTSFILFVTPKNGGYQSLRVGIYLFGTMIVCIFSDTQKM